MHIYYIFTFFYAMQSFYEFLRFFPALLVHFTGKICILQKSGALRSLSGGARPGYDIQSMQPCCIFSLSRRRKLRKRTGQIR